MTRIQGQELTDKDIEEIKGFKQYLGNKEAAESIEVSNLYLDDFVDFVTGQDHEQLMIKAAIERLSQLLEVNE